MISSLRTKLALSHAVPTILLLPLLSLYLLLTLEDFYIHGLIRQLHYQAELMRQDIEEQAPPVVDIPSANTFLATIAPSTDSHLILLDSQGQLLASTRQEDTSRLGSRYDHPSITSALQGQVSEGVGPVLAAEVAYVALPWKTDGQVRGILRVSYEVDDIRAQFDQLQWLVLSSTMAAAVIVSGVAVGLATTISRPLLQLRDRAREVAGGNYAVRAETHSLDEVGLLATSFNQMAGRLEEAQRARERQLAAIAHELRRPITGMRAAVETLREAGDSDPALRDTMFVGIEDELARLERLTNTLQGLHRRALQSMRLNLADVSLERTIRATAACFEPAAARAGISFSVDIPHALRDVRADEDRLIQVLTNLLDNALKFTPRGGSVRVYAGEEPKRITVIVEDTGVGISLNEMGHIFQQFYRGEDSRPPEKRGMGLGLAISREIIIAHGGEIWAESGPGPGARFIFWLPTANHSVAKP